MEISTTESFDRLIPLHTSQENVYFEQLLYPEDPIYNIACYQVLDSANTHREKLKHCWETLHEHLDALQMAFHEDEEGYLYQNPVEDRNAIFLENDFSLRENPEAEALRWMESRLSIPMDFMSGYVSELSLLKVSDDKHFLFFRFHHIATDGMGVHIFLEYFHKLYEDTTNNDDTFWLRSIPDYKTIAANSKNYLGSSRYENDKNYWQEKLKGMVVTKLENFHDSKGSNEVTYKLPKTLSDSMKLFCEQHKISYLILLSSVISVYFSNLLNRPDIAFGTIVHGRGDAKSKKTVGMFSNTVLIKCDIPEGLTLKQLTEQLGKEISSTLRHSRFPYSHFTRLSKKTDQSSADIIINCETFSYNQMEVNKKIETCHLGNKHEKQPLQIRLIDYDFNDDLEIKITYNHRFFDDHEVKLMGKRLLNMLNHCILDIETPVANISILPDEERDILLKDWNETDAEYLKDKTVHQLFESRVVESPDNIALIFDNEKLTYAELNRRANQLAHAIRQKYQNTHQTELTPNTLVALYLDRGFDMIVSILAVLKAGAAYVPISPEFPESRIQFILEDTQAPILISQTSHAQTISHICNNISLSPEVMFCDEYDPQNDQFTDTPKSSCNADNLAYVLYTSGTTGQPKGAMIRHRNICHLIAAQNERFNTAQHNCALQFAAYVFDASAFELFVSLVSGHKVVLCTDEQHRDPEMLAELIRQHNVEIATLPPAILNQMTDSGLESLKTLITAGETPTPDTLRRFSKNRSVHNAYGPTETTVCASSYKINSSQYTSAANIGKPLINARAYVLDASMNPVPIGIPGELYVGGAGLAGGYLNRPELTSERFITNPFATDNDKCNGFDLLYKTGDLVRWLPDGNLEYLGRNDFQVKIRGYRIELGEIEHAMTRIPGIRQAVVIDRDRNNSKYLAAYYVTTRNNESYLSDDIIRHRLTGLLPDYMVPATFVELEAIPITINGKVDRRALPEPQSDGQETSTPPRNAMEQKVCSIWREVLGLDQVGIYDDFFRVGGDSITAIQLVSKLRQSGWTLHVKDIFALPTVARQVTFLNEQTSLEQVKAERGTLTGRFDLLPVQQWFFDFDWPHPNHWNQAFMIKLPGDIDQPDIHQALSRLIMQHDMLRVRFENGQQVYQTDKDACLPVLHSLNITTLNAKQLEQQLTDWQSHFDIEDGPLCCAALLTGYQDGMNRLWFSAHHLVIDFVSWGIIADDLRTLLTHQSLNQKTSSYRQWVEAIKSYAKRNQQEIQWWRELTNDSTTLPGAAGRHRKYWSLSTDKTQQLLGQANTGYHTETKDLLLAALGIALCETFQSDSQLITMEGHGRESIDDTLDVSHTVGWFTTLYPVRLTGNRNIHETIIQTKEMLRAIPNKGIGYGALVQSGALPQAKLPPISFNYLGQLNKGTPKDVAQPWQLDIDAVGATVATDNRSQFLLSIDCAALEQGLQLVIDSQLSEQQTDDFIQLFSQTLEQILSQCTKMGSTGGTYTASDFGMEPLFQQRLETLQQTHDIEAIFPASSLQQGFIHHYLTRPDDDAYRMQLVVDYQQPLNIDWYQQAWIMAAQRFPSLRTAFDWDVHVIQIITRDQSINEDNFNTHDLSALSDQEQQRIIEELQQQHRKPFDLSKPGLIRLSLIKRSDQLYTLIKTEHHSITDGWSGPVLIDTVHRYYDELCQGQHQEVIAETAYIQAQQYQRQQQDNTQRYWAAIKPQFIKTNDISAMFGQRVDLEKMRDVTNPTDMEIIITGKDFNALKELSRQLGVTVNTILQFSWHKLLQTYTGDEQTIVGTIVSGRDLPITDIENSVGLYINTLPLAINWRPDITVEQMLQDTHQHIAALSSHSHISLAELQHDGHRLFHSLFVFENYPMSNLSQTTEIGTHMVIREFYEKADYPLVVKAYEYEDRLMMTLNYSQDWLQPLQAQRLCDQLKQIVMQVVSQSKQPIRNINLSEFDQVQLQRWNNTTQDYPVTTLLDGFCTQVEHAPHTTAVITSTGSISYAELNRQRLALTYHLLDKGVTRSHLVGVLTDKGEAQVTATLAILSTGAAYLPLNVSWPAHRLQEVLIAGGVEHLLISRQQYHNHQQQAWLNNYQLTVVEDVCHRANPDAVDRTTELPGIQPEDIAYVIFTSGSTGKPKGVMTSHQGAMNTITAINREFNVCARDRVLALSDLSFDLSVYDLFGTLAAGATIIFPEQQQAQNPQHWLQLVGHYGVTLWNSVPQLMQLLVEAGESNAMMLKTLRVVLMSGDWIPVTLPTQLKQLVPGVKVISLGGATEGSIWSIWYPIGTVPADWQSIPYGRAMPNQQMWVLDDQGRHCPIGCQGEIHIGGVGVALGYFQDDARTRAQFIDHPQLGRLYKTGDLGAWHADGYIQFKGRKDFQVKIRGYRVELGEIQHVLSQLAPVQKALVIDREREGLQYLAAYIVLEPGAEISDEQLRQATTDTLPDYMQPSSFTRIESIPLTANGKLDRQALPEPVWVDQDSYQAPETELQQQLCDIWQQVLGLEKVGIQDNFYHLGGNSINAIKMAAVIHRQLEIEVPLEAILEQKTIAALTAFLSNASSNTPSLPDIAHIHTDQYSLSFAQERLLFIEQYEQGSDAYHIPYLVELAADAEVKQLERALQKIVDRHQILNSAYTTNAEGQYSQKTLNENISISIETLDHSTSLQSVCDNDLQQPFNLTTEAPMRAKVYQQTDGQQYLLIIWHHIAFDGWSIDVFERELSIIYQAFCQQREPVLPELDISYGDYAIWQREFLQGEQLEQQLTFWQQTLGGYETLVLPTDRPRPNHIDYHGKDYPFSIDAELSQQLRTLAASHDTTLFNILLSAFYATLSTVTGQQDILIGTPSANRRHVQTHNLIGLFVNSLVLRAHITPSLTLSSLFEHVQQVLTQARMHEDLPFEYLVDALTIERDPSRNPIFQVVFGLQNFGQSDTLENSLPFSAVNELGGLSLHSPAKFDLSLFVDDSKASLQCVFNYAISLFNPSTIERFADIYQRLLRGFVTPACERLEDIPVLPDVDHAQLQSWNNTHQDYPVTTLLDGFCAQVEHAPHATAVITTAGSISYAELNRQRLALTYHLLDKGITRSHLVGILTDKGEAQVTAALATLSTGAAYLPLNVSWPAHRLQEVLIAGGVEHLLISRQQYQNHHQQAWLNNYQLTLVEDVCHHASPDTAERTTELPGIQPEDIAYVIFTSGSTGKPKGVMTSHQGAMNTITAINREFNVCARDRVLALSDLSFDLSVYDLFGTLAAGATIIFPEQQQAQNPHHWLQLVGHYGVTLWNSVPQLMQLLVEAGQRNAMMLKTLRVVLMSGDWIPVTLPTQLKQLVPGVKVISLGGATEGSIWSIWYPIGTVPADWQSIPYGRAMPNQQMWVLDDQGRHCPIGCQGEIHIGGAGVALGYFQDEARTRAQFIDHPQLGRLYKTGDLGAWHADGYIQFKGRKDFQVKIRGYRVELGEIQHVLSQLAPVQKALVIDREREGLQYLAAYIVLEPGAEISDEQLRQATTDALPDYMQPSSFTRIESIPLTANGKLDRQALPEPVWVDQDSYQAPETELQQQLCEIWQQVLGLEKVGIQDNFYHLGGNSMATTRLVSLINEQLNCQLSLADAYTHPTIAQLSGLLSVPQRELSLVKTLALSQPEAPSLFMIHPALAGCEVYYSLAVSLSSHFNCYGLDNHNLLFEDKVETLSGMAQLYLQAIEDTHTLSQNVYLLGWSLGGQVALEIAAMLEDRGFNNIQVFLLDSFLPAGHFELRNYDVKSGMAQVLRNNGYEEDQIESALDNIMIEQGISAAKLSRDLLYTKVTLFKACHVSPDEYRINEEGLVSMETDMLNARDNFLSTSVKTEVSIYRLEQRHHYDLLDEKELISSVLFQSLPQPAVEETVEQLVLS